MKDYKKAFPDLVMVLETQTIEEKINLSSFLKPVRNLITSLFKKLGFGQTKKISIRVPRNLGETAGGGLLNKELGEYAEYVAAEALEKKMISNGLEVLNPGTASIKRKQKLALLKPDSRGRTKQGWQYGAEELKNFDKKLKIYTEAGVKIGEEMFVAASQSEDLAFCSFEIMTAGVTESGKSTADLIVRKHSESGVRDQIRASLKVYAKDKIQFYNTGVLGVIFKLLGMEQNATLQAFIEKFPNAEKKATLVKRLAAAHSEQYLKYKELKKVDPSIQNFKLATDFVNSLVREEGLGTQATQIYADFLEELFTEIFQDKKQKQKIIENIFEKMDLADTKASSTIYAVIYDEKKLKDTVFRSDLSPKFAALVKTELKKVDVQMVRRSPISLTMTMVAGKEELFTVDFFLKGGAGLQLGAKLTDLMSG